MQKKICYTLKGGQKMATTKKTTKKEMVKVPTKATTIHVTEKMKENLDLIKAKQHDESGIKLTNSGVIALALACYVESLGLK